MLPLRNSQISAGNHAPYLRKHHPPSSSYTVKAVELSRSAKGCTFTGFQLVLACISTVCGLVFLLGLERTPIVNIYHYEEHLASIMRIDAEMMRVEAENPPIREIVMPAGCDYTKGKWVKDEVGPIYSGRECIPWLADLWACRLSNRTNFDYENYRWQPEDCNLPRFNGNAFLRRMQKKTVAFVGDSLARQQFQSLMCLITAGKNLTDVEDVGFEYGLIKAPKTMRPDGWAYRFNRTNTTILFYWSATLSDLEPFNRSDPRTKVAMHMDRPPSFLRENLHSFDVLVLNTGHHWNLGKFKKNHWKMYVGGKRLGSSHRLRDLKKARNFTVHSAISWLNNQLQNASMHAFLQTLSPRHFSGGEWNSGGKCDNTDLRDDQGQPAMKGPLIDKVAELAVRYNTRVKLLNITLLSQFRDEAHISKYSWKSKNGSEDCIHWCLPGVPDTWNEILSAQLFQEGRLSF